MSYHNAMMLLLGVLLLLPAGCRCSRKSPDEIKVKWVARAPADDVGFVDMAMDKSGQIFLAGHFTGKATFGKTTLSSSWGHDIDIEERQEDIYVAKLDRSGSFVWAIRAGMDYTDKAHGVAVDPKGNVYIGGSFQYRTRLGKLGLMSGLPGSAILVAKLSPSGEFLWASHSSGRSGNLIADVVTDVLGDIYIGGYIAKGGRYGGKEMKLRFSANGLLAKLTPSGKVEWAQPLGDGVAMAVAAGRGEEMFVTGDFKHRAELGDKVLQCAGEVDGYVAKLDWSGDTLWVYQIGGSGLTYPFALATDRSGDLYTVGVCDKELPIGLVGVPRVGKEDLYIIKLSRTGRNLWGRRLGAGGIQEGGVAVDGVGRSYVICGFSGSARVGERTFASAGKRDILVAQLDRAGEWGWALRAGGPGEDVGHDIAVDSSGNVYIAGVFEKELHIGGRVYKGSRGKTLFVAKLAP